MYDPSHPELFWLNVTNIALGLAALACVCVVAYAVVHEAMLRVRGRGASRVPAGPHVLLHPELGLTMGDGGERLPDDGGQPRTGG